MSQTEVQLVKGLNLDPAAPADATQVDSSGRFLIGTTSSIANRITGQLQVVGTGDDSCASLTRYSSATTGSPILTIGRSKSSTKGTNTVVVNGDKLGAIEFTGADGTNFVPAASVSSFVDTDPGAGDMPGNLIFSTTPNNSSTLSERFRINNQGALGIGGENFGTTGQVLTSQGDAAAPQWANATVLETGTWTPQDGTGLLNMNPTQGTWQRIGDLVRMTFNFSVNSNGNPGGGTTVLINNLPFTTTNHPSFGGCLITINGINADQQLLINRNGNTITGITFSRSSSLNNANPLRFSDCANNFHLQGEVWFLV